MKGQPSVYFIQAGKDGPIKIGESDDVKKRLSGLQTSHHETLRVLATLPYPASESALHKEFASDRVRGEWFFPSDRLLSYIAEALKSPEPKPTAVVTSQPYVYQPVAVDILRTALAQHGNRFLPSDLADKLMRWNGLKDRQLEEVAMLFMARFVRARSYEQLIAEAEAAESAGTDAPHGALRVVTLTSDAALVLKRAAK